jgi:protein SCO1/2
MKSLLQTKNTGARAAAVALLLWALWTAPAAESSAAGASRQQDAHRGHGQHQPQTPRRFTRTHAQYAPPDVTLTDAGGAEVRLSSALGHEGPVMLQFIFTTCPTICPVMSASFAAAQDKLGADLHKVRMISISIDPEHDTPERLSEYARKFKAGQQWLFLTGRTDEVVAVQKAFDAYRGNKMRHEPLTFLRAAPGRPWVRLDGLLSAAQLLDEYQRLAPQ